MDSQHHYRGGDIRLYFNGVDISGDGRSVSLWGPDEQPDDTTYGAVATAAPFEVGFVGLEALDVTDAWSAAWESLAEGATGTMVVMGGGVEHERFEARVIARSIKTPYDDLATVSASFETI